MEQNKQNPYAAAMARRYGQTTTVMKDKRQKRRNRKSWRKEVEKEY